MKKQFLFLILPFVSLTLIAVSSYRTLIADRAPAVHQAVDFNLIHQPGEDVPASSGWTLTNQEALMTVPGVSEYTWVRVVANQTKTNPDYQPPGNPGQFYLAGVLIDGQQQLVDAAIPPVEANHAPLVHSNLAVN